MSRFSLNQCIVEGNVAATPEIRHTRDSSRPVSNFMIYVDSSTSLRRIKMVVLFTRKEQNVFRLLFGLSLLNLHVTM